MRRRPPDTPIAELTLMPFLDLVFAFIGILIVIFALQEIAKQATGRPLALDDLVVCTRSGEVTLYAGPRAEPIRYPEHQIALMLERLAGRRAGVRNLVFALTGDCFATRATFEREFARFTSLMRREQGQRQVFRLTYRPLSTAPEALSRLLADWRETDDSDGD